MAAVEDTSQHDREDWTDCRQCFLNTPFDAIGHQAALELIADATRSRRFRYVVTPNADHVVRLNQHPSMRPYYDGAWMTLCDSRPISLFARVRSREITHVTGSDLTASLFQSVVRAGNRVTLIVGSEKTAWDIRRAYPDIDFRVHVPPMDLWRNAAAQQACIDFVLRERARFVFLAVGSPQSEKIAYMLSKQRSAVGVGLCVGASLEFLAGTRKRAPLWMRKACLEWLHRLASDPRRLWRRYVLGAAPLLILFWRELRVRHPDPAIRTHQ